MRNSLKRLRPSDFVRATSSGPRPGDFALGSLESRAAARAIVASCEEAQRKKEESELRDLSPLEQATIEGVENHEVRMWLLKFLLVAQERAKVYQQELPSPEEIRHNRAVAEEIDRMTNGKSLSLSNANSIEWNRLKVIAERNLLDRKK
jgi:hypothetical protein